jgi:hypothetical protein
MKAKQAIRVLPGGWKSEYARVCINPRGDRVAFVGPFGHVISVITAIAFDPVRAIAAS